MDEIEPSELRVVQSKDGPNHFCVQHVYLKGGKPSSYSEERPLFSAATLEELAGILSDASTALQKPVLSEADDFPDQDRMDWSSVAWKGPTLAERRERRERLHRMAVDGLSKTDK
jgi:hypothetical protein